MEEASPEIIDACRRGDQTALGPLFEVYGDRVYALCRRMLGGAEDAEDATQLVFLSLVERARSFSGRSRFSTWLFRLTVNHVLNLGQYEARRRMQSLPEDGDLREAGGGGHRISPVDGAARREAGELVDRVLESLAPEFRAVLVLRELGGLGYGEIAEALGIPEGTVMSRLSRGRERFRAARQRMKSAGESPAGRSAE